MNGNIFHSTKLIKENSSEVIACQMWWQKKEKKGEIQHEKTNILLTRIRGEHNAPMIMTFLFILILPLVLSVLKNMKSFTVKIICQMDLQ